MNVTDGVSIAVFFITAIVIFLSFRRMAVSKQKVAKTDETGDSSSGYKASEQVVQPKHIAITAIQCPVEAKPLAGKRQPTYGLAAFLSIVVTVGCLVGLASLSSHMSDHSTPHDPPAHVSDRSAPHVPPPPAPAQPYVISDMQCRKREFVRQPFPSADEWAWQMGTTVPPGNGLIFLRFIAQYTESRRLASIERMPFPSPVEWAREMGRSLPPGNGSLLTNFLAIYNDARRAAAENASAPEPCDFLYITYSGTGRLENCEITLNVRYDTGFEKSYNAFFGSARAGEPKSVSLPSQGRSIERVTIQGTALHDGRRATLSQTWLW